MIDSGFSAEAIPRPVTLRESAAQILLAQIMSGELAEGETYSVSMIATQLGISPTPVREAVLELADKGLLTIQKNRGFVIPVLTRVEILELHHIRSLLEIPSTVRAGMELDPDLAEDLRRIALLTVEAARGGELVKYVDLDRQFHETFLSALDMPVLQRLIMDYRDRARLRGLRSRLGSTELITAAEEHLQLVDAAIARDEAKLGSTITHHVNTTLERSLAEYKRGDR